MRARPKQIYWATNFVPGEGMRTAGKSANVRTLAHMKIARKPPSSVALHFLSIT